MLLTSIRAGARCSLRPCDRAGITIKRAFTGHSSTGINPLTSVLIANRGEIALRISRTAARTGVRATTIHTDPDACSQHALNSTFSVNIGGPNEYLNGDLIIEVARSEGCDCIHPGYGFLSENSGFAQKCVDAGIVFVGPPPDAIEAMGNKSRSKEIMVSAGVPCIPGYHGSVQDMQYLMQKGKDIGFPVLIKAVKGGGGKGMRISTSPEDFPAQLESAKSEARNAFGDDTVLVEKYITTPRHIEVQIFADKHGNCVALGERDCSVQRRHQKIIEESPAPHLSDATRKDLWQKARDAALAVGYEGAGTVEFIFDTESGEFFFMEMNTRLQVEHPVTEMITGQDLVHWQLKVAEGRQLPLTQTQIEQQILQNGWAIEARVYAEDPHRDFAPDSGRLLHVQQPPMNEDVRIDAGVVQGDFISSHYDPMIAKLIVRGSNRAEALRKLNSALQEYQIAGLATNIEFLKRICTSKDFVEGLVETSYIDRHSHELFVQELPPPEAWVQAAIGLVLQRESGKGRMNAGMTHTPGFSGFGDGYQIREFTLVSGRADGQNPLEIVKVILQQKSPTRFDAVVGDSKYPCISVAWTSSTTLDCFFRHRRLRSNLVKDGSTMTIFHDGKQYIIRQVQPDWIGTVLGKTNVANNVLAPMPCKILRVEVAIGATVCKDQPLIVIESMKMETVIRSPQDGKISRVMHQAGDICKAGAPLVEFEDCLAL